MKTILLVDDNRTLLVSLSDWLRLSESDLTIFTADNGRQAVEILESVPVDLVVTDLKMPVMDGFELLAYMAKNHPGVPVIVMTAANDGRVKERLQVFGISRPIIKPFEDGELSDLRERIHHLPDGDPGSR